MGHLRTSYTILVDDREKRPLTFPANLVVHDPTSIPTRPRTNTVKLNFKKTRLPTGDYQLLESPYTCVIERKKDFAELATNLTTSRGRRNFIAEMVRLQEFRHRILLLEGTPLTLLTRSYPEQPHPSLIRDLLFDILSEYGVELMLLPTSTPSARRECSTWVAARLIRESMQRVRHNAEIPNA